METNIMDSPIQTLDDQVDMVLQKIAFSPTMTLRVSNLYDVEIMDEQTYHLDHFMLEKGLLKISGDSRTITGKGLEIANFGGWLAYQRQLRREKPRHVQSAEMLQRKYEDEISALKREIEKYRGELRSRAEKESASALIIRNLIEQNQSGRLMLFVGGIVTGLVVASVLWYFIF